MKAKEKGLPEPGVSGAGVPPPIKTARGLPEPGVSGAGVPPPIKTARGQSAVEYLLTTLALTTAFAGMYGFMQGQLKKLFVSAAVKMLKSYY